MRVRSRLADPAGTRSALDACRAGRTIGRQGDGAKLVIAGDMATLEDLESKNGSFVRGRLVTEPTRLEDGDRIRLGGFELVFRAATSSGSTETLG